MFVTVCHLELHDFLFYASREMGRLVETEKYLHNYGLTYALGLAPSPYSSRSTGPRYGEDLAPLNAAGIYVTPAYPLRYLSAVSTFKLADEHYYSYTGKTITNVPIYGRIKELAPGSLFEFYIQSERPCAPPRWIRLGKTMAKVCVEIKAQAEAHVENGSIQADGVLNPLDLPLIPENCTIIDMPPGSLITNVFFTGRYYELGPVDVLASRRIRLPVEMSYQPDRRQHAKRP